MAEAGEVADLGDQPQRGAGGDATKPGQDGDGVGPALTLRDRLQVAVKRVQLTVEAVQVDQHLEKRRLGELVVEPLGEPPTRGASSSTASCRHGRPDRAATTAC